jgi:CysZ protein
MPIPAPALRSAALRPPILRAIAQLDDPVFLGVLLRGVAWAAAGLALLAVAVVWGVHALLAHFGLWAWLAALLGGAGAALLSLTLFLPVAALIASLFLNRVAGAVERRFYPTLPPARPAPMTQQIADGLSLGLRVLALQLLALLLAFALPVIGLPLGWLIAAWAIGRGLFMAVAMRRMDRAAAQRLYARRRLSVLTQGALISAASLVPLLNLLAPVLGTAAMVHVLHAGMAGAMQGGNDPNRGL